MFNGFSFVEQIKVYIKIHVSYVTDYQFSCKNIYLKKIDESLSDKNDHKSQEMETKTKMNLLRFLLRNK